MMLVKWVATVHQSTTPLSWVVTWYWYEYPLLPLTLTNIHPVSEVPEGSICSPWPPMLMLPVPAVAGVAPTPDLLCSLPLSVTEPAPGVGLVAGLFCSVPLMVRPPLAWLPAVMPLGS